MNESTKTAITAITLQLLCRIHMLYDSYYSNKLSY